MWAAYRAPNSLEFHWYSVEEDGLLGSQAAFGAYESARVDVGAMLALQRLSSSSSSTARSPQFRRGAFISSEVMPETETLNS